MLVTEYGRETAANFVFLKAPPPIVVTPSGIFMVVRALQPSKADLPILLIVEGSCTLVTPSRADKEKSPMLVTPSPTTTFVASLLARSLRRNPTLTRLSNP